MKTDAIVVKAKGVAIGTYDYEFPEDLEEGLEADGEEKVFKLYAQQRKIRWMDNKRREVTGGGLPKQITDALKSLNPDQLAAIAAQLGLEL